MVAAHTFSLIGCGYSATHIARVLLAEQVPVVATRRTEEGVQATRHLLGPSATVVRVDLGEPATIAAALAPGQVVVVSAAPSSDGSVAQEHALVAAAAAARVKRLIYLSSTGVYASGGGQWIDESWSLEPFAELGQRRLAAETAVLEDAASAGISAVALRCAAIYGPNRGAHVRIAKGSYRVIGEGAGYVSRIHVHDLARLVIACGRIEVLSAKAYNVADECPTTSREFADRAAEILGVSAPPSIPADQVSAVARGLMGGNRRVDGGHLRRELGIELLYPSYREGLAQALGPQAIRAG